MNLEIITEPLHLNIHGFSGIAENKDYVGTAFKLMDKMWQAVKSNNLKNKGLNIWVYEEEHGVFAGVELDDLLNEGTGLEQKSITLSKYARYKHMGPYNLIRQSMLQMITALKSKGYQPALPHIEIYGHWTNDDSKLETDLLICLK